MPEERRRRAQRRVPSKSPARKSRPSSRSRSRGRSKSPGRTKVKNSPSPARRSPARSTRAKSTEAKTPSTPTRVSARIAQKEQEKEQAKVETVTEVKAKAVSSPPKKDNKKQEASSKFTHGFAGPLFATLATLAVPVFVLALNFACSKTSCTLKNVTKMPRELGAYFNQEAFVVFTGFLLLQAVLSQVPLGKVVQGFPNSQGKTLPYRCNGFIVLTTLLLAIGVASYQEVSFAYVLQHLNHFIVSGTFISFALSVFLYIKARKAPAQDLSEDGQSGCTPYDFFLGKELNPRVRSFDFKYFGARFGAITWSVLNVLYVLESQTSSSNLNQPLVAVAASQIFYVADVLWFESALLGTLGVRNDGAGFQAMYGSIVFVPFIYSLQSRFLMEHPQSWSYAALGGFLVLFLIGYVIMRGSNSQKDQFRRNPNNPALSHLETIPSPSGKRLLLSGWWGLVRHPNYLGDLIMSLAWAVPCGCNFVAFLQPILLVVLLVHRVYQDDLLCRAKHGAAWDRYCQRVKYRIVPYVF